MRDGNALVLAVLALVAALCALPLAWNFASSYEGYLQLRAFTFRLVVNAMAIWVGGYFAFALLLQARVWHWRWRFTPAVASSPSCRGTKREP